jgi:hypothetical protein
MPANDEVLQAGGHRDRVFTEIIEVTGNKDLGTRV